MAMTILESAKVGTPDSHKQAIVEIYAGSSSVLSVMPFENIPGGGLTYDTQDTLPGVAFRGINEAYVESTGVINPQTERLVIAGGDMDTDKFLIQTKGRRQRAIQEAMKSRALSLFWTKTYFKGDSTTNPKEFDGLQKRITGDQLVNAGNTSGGDALSLAQLDLMLSRLDNPMYLFMSVEMRLKFDAAARTPGVAGNINYETTQFGEKILRYANVPILTVDLDNTGAKILPFTEANPGGGTAASTSIYAVEYGDLASQGIQNGDIDVRDLGELDDKPVERTRVEWYNGFAIYKARSVARLNGIKNAAITA
jgi:hypothetical protein